MKIRTLLFLFLSISQLTVANSVDLPPTVSIVYTNNPFCVNSFMPSNVTITGTGNFTGGTFSSMPGLVINSTTGVIDLATSVPGTYVVTYTIPPMGGDPAVTATTTVNIYSPIVPVFSPIQPICLGDSPPLLPTTSINFPITGTWSPSTIDTSIVGAFTYIFTPNPGQCATSTAMTIIVYPLPTLNTPPAFQSCEDFNPNDGFYPFDLSALIPGILGGQDPSVFYVTFHETQADAQMANNPIANLGNYQAHTQTLWIRVGNTQTGCAKVSPFSIVIEQYPTPVIQTSNNNSTICVDYNTGNVLAPLTLNAVNLTNYLNVAQVAPPMYTYQWYMDGVLMPGAIAPSYTVNTNLPGGFTAIYTVEMTSQSMLGCASDSFGYAVFQSGPATPIGIGYTIVNNSGNQTLTIEVQGYGTYQYALDGGVPQSSPVFTNVAVGIHTVVVYDVEAGPISSCNYLTINGIDVNTTPVAPPTGNTTQSFGAGATLANVQVNGQNIQWYSGADKNAASTPLPLSTQLVNNTTYFASQKIGGYESTSRLPVLVYVTLGNSEFESNGLTFYPNPVSDNLNIHHDRIIKEVSVYTILGQKVLNKKATTSDMVLDVTSLNQGVYFVKVTSDTGQSTFKIIKK